MEENNRRDKIKNSLLDTATDEITNAGNEAVKVVLRDIKDWISDRYKKLKEPKIDPEQELKKLQMMIEQENKTIEIGMEKKEIAVMWAMRKLGYPKEEVDKVLDMANQAYGPKEEKRKA